MLLETRMTKRVGRLSFGGDSGLLKLFGNLAPTPTLPRFTGGLCIKPVNFC
jgi:hypothetical protein